ncbi:MAG: PASTA domain-containing protein [Bacilli bacterium]|nr:PASTA domain-containing protein [Bacilli bacterium]
MKKRRIDNEEFHLTNIDVEELKERGNKRNLISPIITIITFISMFLYLILIVKNANNLSSEIPKIIGISILLIFSIVYFITGSSINSKKRKVLINISAVILFFFSLFNILVETNIIYKDKNNKVIDFTNMNIEEVLDWGNKNNIEIIEIFEYNDTIDKDLVFKQSVKVDTPIKNIKKITVTVSNGPNKDKYNIPSMIGWDLDKVLDYLDEKKISNVIINFEYNNDVEKDIVFKQNTISTLKSDQDLILTVSLGNKDNIRDVKMTNLVGENTFNTTIWLKRNCINYNIEYSLSSTYNEGTIIGQSINKNITFNPLEKKVTIIIASKTKVTVPDFENMTVDEINKWANTNKINIYYEEFYNETIAKGKIILDVETKGNIISPNETIKLKVSKGQLRMIKFTDLNTFTEWADKNNITYNINYEFNESIPLGDLISISHDEGDIISNSDSINIVISQGGTVKVPDFINKTKTEVDQICNNSSFKCIYEYETNSSVAKDTCIKQSMKKDSFVPVNTSITITFSK